MPQEESLRCCPSFGNHFPFSASLTRWNFSKVILGIRQAFCGAVGLQPTGSSRGDEGPAPTQSRAASTAWGRRIFGAMAVPDLVFSSRQPGAHPPDDALPEAKQIYLRVTHPPETARTLKSRSL
jgi:hypothetical protein